MTEPSQYFKGRTVQEQMNEVIGYVDTRAAEVATDAIAADVAQVHQDMLDADADASAAAASAAAAAGTLANAVKKTGEASQSIAGNIAVSGNLTGGTVTVPTPVNNTDAANKKYVDDADALKANKTYVDAQDALKVNIANINQYAVGLTGNQNPIAGVKTFSNNMEIKAGKNSKLLIYTNTEPGEIPTTPSVMDIEFYRGTTYSGRIAETIDSDGSASIDIMIKANQISNKEGRLQMYEDINNSKFVLRFWNGNTWTVLG